MSKLYNSEELNEEGKLLIKSWIGRVWYLVNWHYALEQKRAISDVRRDVSYQAYDADGNVVIGLSDEDNKQLEIVLSMKEILLKVFLRLPELYDRSVELVDKIENLNICIWAIINHKVDELDYLIKCAEAAEEFKDAE